MTTLIFSQEISSDDVIFDGDTYLTEWDCD